MKAVITLAQFEAFAEEFASDHLDNYVLSLEQSGQNPSRKEINDPLWGTIGLNGAEVAILDSPLLQRLRLIRQLGVVHWVYPGAIHTRFEHSLGVLRQVQYVAGAINGIGAQQGLRDLIETSKMNLLRIAGLLHDIGHAAFSHVSEHAMDSLDILSSLPSDFARLHKAEKRSLSEIFAYFVVKSKSMKKLIGVLVDHDNGWINLSANRSANVEEIVSKIGRAIIGRSIDDRLPLLHEIISGPFDADKLDYFVRDARNAGIPSLLDISRLIQKIALREFDATDLPGDTGRDVKAQNRHVLVGIKWSGISILDELQLSRVLLYSKIYRHPKVVAIEQMIKAALLLLAEASDPSRVLRLVYAHGDDELLAMAENGLATALNVDLEKLDEVNRGRFNKAASIFRALRMRRLFVKAFTLQRTYPGDTIPQEEEQKAGLIEFREVIEQAEDREKFRQALIGEVERILSALGRCELTRTDLEGGIMIQSIGATPGGAQIGRAFLIPKSGPPTEFKSYIVDRRTWADSYLSDQPAGFVFADQELADITYIAVERLLRANHGISLPPSALELSKRDDQSVQAMKTKLKEAGYYADAPFDIRPSSPRLRDADIAKAIANFEPKLQSYQAPVLPQNLPPLRRAPDVEIKNWLSQFDCDDDVECAAELLNSIRMLNRTDTVDAVRNFIAQNPEFSGATLVPFGNARDSSAIHGYFASDLIGSVISECLTLDDAAQRPNGKPIIFIDDFVGSGGQSRDILAAGFGRKDLRADLSEERNLFSSDIQKFLHDAKVAFVFTAAWDDGVTELIQTNEKIGLDALVWRWIAEKDIPFIDGALAALPPEQVASFKERSRLIGAELLKAESKQKPNESNGQWLERLAGRGLGYGNRGMLLASPFNIPTQTFTPLWAHGKSNGAEWKPLMPRRKKT